MFDAKLEFLGLGPLFEAGLRYVLPYYFTFTTHAKGRWVGSTVYGVFCKEFQAEKPDYYVSCFSDWW